MILYPGRATITSMIIREAAHRVHIAFLHGCVCGGGSLFLTSTTKSYETACRLSLAEGGATEPDSLDGFMFLECFTTVP